MCSEISLTVQQVVKCSPSVFLSRRKICQHIHYLGHPLLTVVTLKLQEAIIIFLFYVFLLAHQDF